MTNFFQKLVAERGEAAARQYMRSLRSRVKSPGGFNTMDPERVKQISRMGVVARHEKKSLEEPSPASETTKE